MSKNNVYASKSVCTLSQRVNGHRSKFYELCETLNSDKKFSVLDPGDVNDDYVLGAHLFSAQNKRDKLDFNYCFLFNILYTTSPENIRKPEQLFIDKLRALHLFGQNNIKTTSGN